MLKIWLEGANQSHEDQQRLLDQLGTIQNIIRMDREIPTQILLSKPAILLDARGRYCPFHLEFVDSADVRILPSHSKSKSHNGPDIGITGFDCYIEGPLQ